MSGWEIREGDCLDLLRGMEDGSVQCCVTSPPYWGLRDYGQDGQLGLEETPAEYVSNMVRVFREVRRVLRDDGTLWLNLGDSYCGYKGDNYGKKAGNLTARTLVAGVSPVTVGTPQTSGLKPKDLVGIPWRVAFALQADGWYLRLDIIWSKPNPMPESVTDRPTKAHEYLFLLSKSARYLYNHKAIKEQSIGTSSRPRFGGSKYGDDERPESRTKSGNEYSDSGSRNKRSVWTVSSQPFAGAHFATFPPKLIEPCILAGSEPGDTILDPFSGSGTTGMVALRHDRSYVGIELNPDYAAMSRDRIRDDAPLLNTGIEAVAA